MYSIIHVSSTTYCIFPSPIEQDSIFRLRSYVQPTDHFIVHSACLQHSTVTMRLDSLFGCGHLKDDWNIHFLLESYAPASLSFVTQNPAKEG